MTKTYKQLLSETGASQYTNDDQWLAPAAHDKKMLDMMGDVLVHDVADYDEDNFSAGKDLKKDTSKAAHTTSYGNPEMPLVKEDQDDVSYVYQEHCYDLLDEIVDLLDNLVGATNSSYSTYQTVNGGLRDVRDTLLQHTPRTDDATEAAYDVPVPMETVGESENIQEAFKPGNLKLKDGTLAHLSSSDATHLNKMMGSTQDRKGMMSTLMKNKKEFSEMITFAKDLKEVVDFEEVKNKRADGI